MKYVILAIYSLVALASCQSDGPTVKQTVNKAAAQKPPFIFNIRDIAGKSPHAVEKLLGKHDPEPKKQERITDGPCSTVPCETHEYESGAVEITYINKKADWITINRPPATALNSEVITMLGLPISTPDFENPGNVVRWEFLSTIREISAFGDGQGQLDHFYIEYRSKP